MKKIDYQSKINKIQAKQDALEIQKQELIKKAEEQHQQEVELNRFELIKSIESVLSHEIRAEDLESLKNFFSQYQSIE